MALFRRLFFIMCSVVVFTACQSGPASTRTVSSTNAALTADIESSGSSGGVAGGELIPINDVLLTSDPGDPDAIVSALSLTGQANITGSFRANDFARVVESCVLYEAAAAVSAPVIPDASGRMNFSGLSLMVPAMGETRIGVRCDFDNALDNPSGELVTVGIASEVDLVALGTDMGSIPVTVTSTAMREAGATGEDPMLGVPVAPAGDIVIALDPAGPSGAIIPDGTLQLIASGSIVAEGEDIVLEQSSLSLAGDAAAYDDIAIFIGGNQVGTAVAGTGIDSTLDVTLTGGMSILRRDVSQPLELRARLATLVPRPAVGSAAGSAVSGNRIALGIADIRGTGVTSAAPSTSPSVPTSGNTFVVRGSTFSITLEPITGSSLFAGRAFPVLRALITGRGELGRLVVDCDRTMTPDYATLVPGYTFYGINVFQDDVRVDTATVSAEDGTDLRTAVYPFPAMDIARIIIAFPGGLPIDGTSAVEIQMAFLGTISATDVLSIGVGASTATESVTGYLADDTIGAVAARPTAALDPGTDLGPGGSASTLVLAWSDVSGGSHNTLTASTGGSRDWINEYGLGDLSPRSVIRAP